MSDSDPSLPACGTVMRRCARVHRRAAAWSFLAGFLLLGGTIEALALDPTRSLNQYNVRVWRRIDQLPSNYIATLAQANDGHLWLGTPRGLVDFDGIEFKAVGLPGRDATGSRIVHQLAPRRQGGFWVATEHNHVGVWDGKVFAPIGKSEDTHQKPNAIAPLEASDGSLFVSANGALIRHPPDGQPETIAPALEVLCLREDTAHRVWIGTATQGLYYWHRGTLTHFAPPGGAPWAQHNITALVVDPAGSLWIAAGNGLHSLTPDLTPGPSASVDAHLSCLLLDRQGTLWLGSLFEGLFRYRNGSVDRLTHEDGLASNQILSLAETTEGSIWVGTDDGLTQLSEVKIPTITSRQGLAGGASLHVTADPSGGVWVGTNNGLSRIVDGQCTNYGVNRSDNFPSTWIRRILVARNRDLYFLGGRQDLSRLRAGRIDRVWPLAQWSQSLVEDAQGILLTDRGRILRLVDDELTPYRLADGSEPDFVWIHRLHVDREGSLWIAADTGLAQVRDGKIHFWSPIAPASDQNFFSLSEDEEGAIWASRSSGLVRIKDGRVSTVDQRQGLHSDLVYAMIADLQGHCWMDSPEGIFRVNKQELDAVADGTLGRLQCTVFDGPSFVKSSEKTTGEYSACRSLDGQIWFTNAKGVICIDPARIPLNPHPPPLRLLGIRIDGREYPVDREPDLKPGTQNLEFTYSAIDFQAPERVRYRYRLTGFQDEWVDAGTHRTAYFSSLPPGEYTFQVQACNADGVWNTQGASFHLSLLPEMRATLWFRLAVAAAGLGLLGAAWIYRDRNRRRELIEIRHREKLQMEMIESSPVAMLMLDRQHRVLYVNATFTRVFGYTATELPDLATWWRLAWTDSATLDSWSRSWESRLTTAAAAGRSIEPVETTLAHKDRTLRYTAITTSAVGERTLVICSDLTERKRAEEERLHLEEQLQQGQKMEAIGRLSGGIAHDFNNLLTVILGNISLLELDATYPPEAASSIRDIRAAAKRAANLTSQLLAFSRKQPLQAVDMDLNQVVREMTSMLQRIVGEDVRMEIQTPDTPLLTQADPTKIEQVVLNLVLNARDAMPGGGRLQVETSLVEIPLGAVPAVLHARPGRFVRLSVSDTGCGIHPEIRPHIFEPFLTTKEVGKGTGLGLAIVFGIVEQHKGWVDVQSELMRGTTFSIYLPAGLETSPLPLLPDDESLAERSPPRSRRILLVEDDAGVRAYARKTLINQGHQVYEAASGLLAIPVWTQHADQIDILFTDVVMPDGISGLELARHLVQEKPSLKVIYTSGYSAEIAEGAFAGRQGVDFLPKPYAPPDLIRMIDRASAGLPPS